MNDLSLPQTTRLDPIAHAFAFRHASDAQISPDAARLCFVLTRRDAAIDRRVNTLMVSEDRRTWHELADSAGASGPRWSPDGTRLAYLRRDGAVSAVVVHDFATGQARVLVEGATALRDLAWSPDGRSLAWQAHVDAPPPAWLKLPHAPDGARWAPTFAVTERILWRHDTVGDLADGGFQVMVAPADRSAAPRQLTEGVWSSGFVRPADLSWTVDGTELLLAATRRPDWDHAQDERDVYAIAIKDGAVRRLTERPGQQGAIAVCPDGRRIAFTGVTPLGRSAERRIAFVMDLQGGEPREVLPGFDRSIESLAWHGDGVTLFATYDEEGGRVLARIGADGSVTPLVRDVTGPGIEMPYANGGFSLARDGTLAYVRNSATVPSEVAVVSPDGDVATLTSLNAELAQEVGGFAPTEMLWVTARAGHRVQCWLMLPREAADGPVPLALEIHGGPFASFGDRFSIKHQMMAAAGYAVLGVNPRGSTGYGEEFLQALHDRYPGPDWDDLMDALDVVAARPEIDADNLFVGGVSGGGTLTLWSVGHTDRFRAAVSIKPVVAWESWVLTADIGPSVGRTWMGGDLPWEADRKYRDRSPLTHLARAKTPTMVIAGETDSRTPASEALQAYTALKLAGVEAAYVRGPAVSHSSGVYRPSHFVSEVICQLAWFERFRTN